MFINSLWSGTQCCYIFTAFDRAGVTVIHVNVHFLQKLPVLFVYEFFIVWKVSQCAKISELTKDVLNFSL